MEQRLLSGEQEYVDPGSDLGSQIEELRHEMHQFTEQAGVAISMLRQQVETIRKGLGFAIGDSSSGVAPSAPQFDQKWDAWKQKLGSGTAPARVIDALLTHGPLTRTQLRQAGELGWSTLDAATARLKNLQLIEKVGDRWNLKG